MSLPSDERNQSGQFKAGNAFSDDRNKHLRVQALRAEFAEAISESDVQALARKLLGLAMDGDVTAARLLLGTIFKEPAAPRVAIQNNTTINEADRKRTMLAILDRIQQGRGSTSEHLPDQ